MIGHRKVAILGFAYDGEGFDPEGWECWGINYPAPWAIEKKVEWARFYQLHPRDTIEPEEEAWCIEARCPIFVWHSQKRDYRVPRHRRILHMKYYPLTRIRQRLYLQGHDGLFASSFSYAMAHAIYESRGVSIFPGKKVMEIGLFGMGLTRGTPRERLVEYPSLLWWMGFARGRGITITLPKGSELLHYPFEYGLRYHEEVTWVNHRVAEFGKVLAAQREAPDPLSRLERAQRIREIQASPQPLPFKRHQRGGFAGRSPATKPISPSG